MKRKQAIRPDQYDDFAETYRAHASRANSWNNLYERPSMLAKLPALRGLRVLDLGCGSGYYTRYALAEGATVVAVDGGAKLVEALRQEVAELPPGASVDDPADDPAIERLQTFVADVSQGLPFLSDRSIDVVVSSLVLHYIEDYRDLVDEIARVLVPEGRAFISIQHPFADAVHFDVDDYFASRIHTDTWGRSTRPFTVSFVYRSLTDVLAPFIASSLQVEEIDEPRPSEELARTQAETYRRLIRFPPFLFVTLSRPAEDGAQSRRCRKPAILEFDPARRAVINPEDHLKPLEAVSGCVLTFFHDEVRRIAAGNDVACLAELRSQMGSHPVYALPVGDRIVGLCALGVGAPLAAGMLEELIALGFDRFMVCGGAGVLDSTIDRGRLIVPDRAVRQEGTSYHYAPMDAEARPSPEARTALEAALGRAGANYLVGATWTTDAFYRETHDLVRRRREEGCVAVEMEAAALFAVAEYRGVHLAQVLYGGDDVSQETWDPRGWGDSDVTTRVGSDPRTGVRPFLIALCGRALRDLEDDRLRDVPLDS